MLPSTGCVSSSTYDRLTGVHYDSETTNRYTYEYGADGEVGLVRDSNLGRVLQTQRDLANRPWARNCAILTVA
jgi:hypothetical protein